MTIYDNVWPTSFVDQKHQSDLLLDRAKVLYARKTAVTLVRWTAPTQGDWENAFVAKTGLPLPIPIGTRLFWKSLKSGRILQYGTINDISNGVASSGKVFNLLNMDYDQPTMRFIGYYDSSKAESLNRTYPTGSTPQFFIPSMTWLPSGTFVFGLQLGQIYYWMSKGLDTLMMVYRCRTADLIATPSPKLELFFNKNNNPLLFGASTGADAMESIEVGMPGSATTAALLGTPTVSQASGRIPLLSKQTASDSAANVFSYGQLWFHNVSQQLETVSPTNSPRENYHNPAVWGIGSYVAATITEANTNINLGAVIKEDQGYTFTDFFNPGIAYPTGTGLQSSKLWVYGIFKNTTGELSE